MIDLKYKLTDVHLESEAIIQLHGLARTSHSMNKAGKLFAAYGYKVKSVMPLVFPGAQLKESGDDWFKKV